MTTTPPDLYAAGSPLRRAVAIAAALNFGYFWVEIGVALAIGSVSLVADSVDFLEDTAINVLILLALRWSATRRAMAGKAMAGILLLPASAAAFEAFSKVRHPEAPDVRLLIVTALGAAVVNGTCAWILARVRHHGGSLSRAAYLSARNDVTINLAIIAMAGVTAWTHSGWPDLALGALIILINLEAAHEVWQAATAEHLAAQAES